MLRDSHGDLVVPFEPDEMRPAMRGALLAPWPNRTADGRYEFGGVVHQLPVNEPERGSAAHGLVAWQHFDAVRQDASHVTLAGTIEAQPGYPWRVQLEVSFDVDANGLRQRVVATNDGGVPAPLGLGGHPYLAAGPVLPGGVEGWFLELPADLFVEPSPGRLLPVSVESVAANDAKLDFRERRIIGGTVLNHAFGALHRGTEGLTRVRVTDELGFGVELECGSSARWIQVYTCDAADRGDRRHAIAIEPMTCPPDALNSKIDLIVLEPGSTFVMEWRIARVTA